MISRNRVPHEVQPILAQWAEDNVSNVAGLSKMEVQKMFMKFLRANHPEFRSARISQHNAVNAVYRVKQRLGIVAPGKSSTTKTAKSTTFATSAQVTLSFRAMASLNKWFEANIEVARSLTIEELTSSVNAEFQSDAIFAGILVTKATVAALVQEYGVELPTRFRDGKTKANYKFAVIAADMVKIADALKERGWIDDVSQETRNFARGIFAQED